MKEALKHKVKLVFVTADFFILRFMSNYFESGLGFQLRYELTNFAPPIMTNRTGQCGGHFFSPKGIITSPSYPDNYPDDTDCVYTISQTIGTVIRLTFLAMDIEYDTTCKYDYLEIRDGPLEDSPILIKLCGNGIPDSIQSGQNELWMR